MDAERNFRRRAIASASIVAVLTALLVPLGATSATAAGAPPAVSIVSPAAGSTGIASPTSLQVTPTDADDSSLSVEFHAQARVAGTPNPSAPFTFLVIPDTQNYASAASLSPIMAQQTQWIANHRSDLNLAFVAHLGDIVGVDTVDAQWQRASAYMATLDAAGIPNSVLPGNHDMNLATGTAPLYEQYFPVSRYAGASWNSATASYGGYLGENQFGPDPVDRENMDNYALFSGGGMDFLLLNLEFNPPDYAIDWAKRVLAAYPNRRAILATHSYVDYVGGLTTQVNRDDGGNSGQQLFTKLVQPNCSIFLVVNGHFHNGEVSEARRTDTNSCGGTVNSILSDYQDRANGGDGYLRYYTFVPSANQIQAHTYSTYLGQFETDADSQFTIPYDMTAQPAYPLVGTATTASGGVAAAAAPSVPPGTTVDWYATVSDGTTTTRSQTWSYTTAAAGAAPLAADGFGRAATAGWGNADTGGPWTLVGGTTRFNVADGTGNQVIEAGRTVSSAIGTLASTSTDLRTTMSLDRLSGEVYATASGRLIGAADYGARVKVLSTGAVQLHLERSGTLLVGNTIPGLTAVPGQKLRIRMQVDGISPTTLRAKVWKDGNTEPTSWQYTTTDNTAGLQSGGGIRLQSYASAAVTGGTMTIRWDDLAASAIGGASPNQPPHPSFTSSTSNLVASVDSSGSSDPDGAIVARAWTFGDGGTASGTTATHSYATAGTYQVVLTVTDDKGASGTFTAPVTVTAPAGPAIFAADSFGRTVSNAWGAADSGGAWAVGGTLSRYSVANGTGALLVPAGATVSSTLSSVSSSSTDLRVSLSQDTAQNNTVYSTVSGRVVGSADYGAQVKIYSSGSTQLWIERNGTTVVGGVIPGLLTGAGAKLNVRVQVQGTAPTVIRAKVWAAGGTEPAAWQYTLSDSTAGLQSAGAIRLSTYLSSAATTGPVTVRWDDLQAAPVG